MFNKERNFFLVIPFFIQTCQFLPDTGRFSQPSRQAPGFYAGKLHLMVNCCSSLQITRDFLRICPDFLILLLKQLPFCLKLLPKPPKLL